MTDITPARRVQIESQKEEIYAQLVEQLRTVTVETAYRIDMEKLEARYEMGRMIVTSGLYEPYAYGAGLVKMLSHDMGISQRHLYWLIRFYRVGEERGGLLELTKDLGKHQIKWHVIRDLLGDPDEIPKLPLPRKKAKPYKAFREMVAGYCNEKIGAVWTQGDQIEIERLLSDQEPLDGKAPRSEKDRGAD